MSQARRTWYFRRGAKRVRSSRRGEGSLPSSRASRKMARSPRLAHKAPVIQATYTTTQIDNAKAVPLASQLCELRARVLLALL